MRIVIYPGHSKGDWGTQYRNTKELDLNIELSKQLYEFISTDDQFDVFLAQDENGFREPFRSYFEENTTEILAFKKQKVAEMQKAIKNRSVNSNVAVEHNFASTDASVQLYGTNKWANENYIDVVIHVHFNDYPGRRYNSPGRYDGFSIYVPEYQYANSNTSTALAASIRKTLDTIAHTSTHPKESYGIIRDQELIAIGASGTLNALGLLIEYGYVYEDVLHGPTKNDYLKELAYQTYRGVETFFAGSDSSETEKSILLPHTWDRTLREKMRGDTDVLALQLALSKEELYPPQWKERSECPINGSFFSCTKRALKTFQKKYGIEETGIAGPLTRAKLNKLFSETK